jgi:lipopolysaccharide assembly outer membrane protein LptD (OstA)
MYIDRLQRAVLGRVMFLIMSFFHGWWFSSIIQTFHQCVTSIIFESGVGASYQITDSIAFRSDVRYRLNSFLNDKSDGEVFHDVTINFGFVTNV